MFSGEIMCGITGYVGEKQKVEFLFENLKKLEYRGYDSSGLAYFNDKEFKFVKSLGNMDKLRMDINLEENFCCGIGHTRWATNGCVSLENTHPVISQSGEWVLVHNGIIENAEELRQRFKIKTKGSTDSEIIVNLLEMEKNGDYLEKIKKVCEKLKGSWAMLILNRKDNDKIYVAKRKSPIYFCKNANGCVVSSDPICFCKDEYYSLADNCFGIIEKEKIATYDANLNIFSPKKYKIKDRTQTNNKGNYSHYMLKEIEETPIKLRELCEIYDENFLKKNLKKNILDEINFIKIIGCGSAYHSALIGAYYFRKNLKIEAEAYLASEFKSSNQVVNKEDLFIFVSQSGETADTIECLKQVKKHGAKTIVLTNNLESSMSKLSKMVLPICAGPEIAVASTKAYSCQLAVFYILAKYFRSLKINDINFDREKNRLENIANKIEKIDVEKIKKLSICAENVYFLGKGRDYFTSLESSLKFKEITYINSQCCPIGELKHGPLAVVDENFQGIIFLSDKKYGKKVLNGIHEITSRGGKVLIISSSKDPIQTNELINRFDLDCVPNELSSLVHTVFAQYLVYYICLGRGLNPDQPRNLAKSVTVE